MESCLIKHKLRYLNRMGALEITEILLLSFVISFLGSCLHHNEKQGLF